MKRVREKEIKAKGPSGDHHFGIAKEDTWQAPGMAVGFVADTTIQADNDGNQVGDVDLSVLTVQRVELGEGS